MKRRILFPLGIAALAVALAFAVAQLFTLRFERGDIYPPYSTLRADPLGAKAFYEALSDVKGFEVRRNFLPLEKHQSQPPVTLMYPGIQRRSVWGEGEIKKFEALVSQGLRAVFAFAPEEFDSGPRPLLVRPTPRKKKTAPTPQPTPPEGNAAAPAQSADEPTDEKGDVDGGVQFSDRLRTWGAAFALPRGARGKIPARRAIASADARQLEGELPWHSALYFKELAPPWRTLYSCEGKPVVIERNFGDGTIVLAGDAYFLSNEAVARERSSRFLAWLVGSARVVVFDEEHHGIADQANLASLIPKYRLHGVVAGLALIAGLVLWKEAVPFLPARRVARDTRAEVRGKDADAGFINLLRRSVPPRQVIGLCVDEWEKTAGDRATDAERAQVRAVARTHDAHRSRDPVAAFREIANELAKQRKSPRT